MKNSNSKAAQKRQKDLYNLLNSELTYRLQAFKNKYLEDYIAYETERIRRDIINIKQDERMSKYAKDYHLGLLETKLSMNNINALEWLTEANKNYESKKDRLIRKLVEAGMKYRELRVEKVSNAGEDLAFLISDNEKEVHARFIYASGIIQRPHFRFITTIRNK